MHKITLALACLACVGHGQQGQPSAEPQVDWRQFDKQEDESGKQTSLGSLAMLLMASRPFVTRSTVRYPVGRGGPVMYADAVKDKTWDEEIKIPKPTRETEAQQLRREADEFALAARKAQLEVEKAQLEMQLMKQTRQMEIDKEEEADKDRSGDSNKLLAKHHADQPSLVDGERPPWPHDKLGQFHRFVERKEKTSDKVTGLQYKVRPKFIGSKREGDYQKTYRVSFALPGDESGGGETVELLQTSKGKPSKFGAIQVKMTDLVLSVTELAEVPLTEEIIRGQDLPQDPWANVVNDDAHIKMANEVFAKFDEDGDGYWNHKETSQAQLATEGAEMEEEAYNSLVKVVASYDGKEATEEDLRIGLSLAKVVELYTNADIQRQLGAVLDVQKDHDKVARWEKLNDKVAKWESTGGKMNEGHGSMDKVEGAEEKKPSDKDVAEFLKNFKIPEASKKKLEDKDFPTQLIVTEVSQAKEEDVELWDKLNLKEGDIIRAMSIPDREKEEASWWNVPKNAWKAVMGKVPEADNGMIYFERHSIEDFYKALQENLRVGGFDAEAVILVERPENPTLGGELVRVRTKAF